MQTSKFNLKAREATEDDWKSILNLLEETKLSFWFVGEENYRNFYVVSDNDSKIINCFAFYIKDDIGLLKQFAVSNVLQGKGIGTYIANNIVPEVAKELGLKKLYLQAGNKKPFTSLRFWEKTVFKHIDKDLVKDKYAKEYFDDLEKALPEHFFKEGSFYIEI